MVEFRDLQDWDSMPSSTRACIAGFLLVVVATVFKTLLGGMGLVGYVLLALLCLYALLIPTVIESEIGLVSVLVVLSFVLKIIVIDPVEIGLYGEDPAATLRFLADFQATGDIGSLMEEIAWPITYVFVTVLERVSGIEQLTVAKYYPLITVLVPVLLFLFAARIGRQTHAYVATVGVVVLRSSTKFHSKFVDELIAIVLFFLLLFILTLAATSGRHQATALGLAALTGAAFVLSHPAAAVLGAGLVLILGFAAMTDLLPYLTYDSRNLTYNGTLLGLAIIISTISIFIFFAPEAIVFQIIDVLSIESSSAGAAPNTSQSASENLPTIIRIYGHVMMIAVFSLIIAYGVLSQQINTTRWDLAFTVYAGGLTALYAFQLVFGGLIGYDPVRYLIFFIPFLIFLSARILDQIEILQRHVEIAHRRIDLPMAVLVFLVFLFVITQLAVFAPHILYSDPAEKPISSEGHYTSSGYATTDFYRTYGSGDDGAVLVYDKGLWGYGGYAVTERISAKDCNNRFVAFRPGHSNLLIDASPTSTNTVYSAGDLQLRFCT